MKKIIHYPHDKFFRASLSDNRVAKVFFDYHLPPAIKAKINYGHEWQAKFHWHCEDLGMRHVYIKPRTPRLNGKVERS